MRRNSEFLYRKLYGIIKEQILSGFIRPGDYLLPESELCRLHSMSRNSVRKALDELQKEGLVTKRPGLGTMVPEDVSIHPPTERILRILVPSPSFFVDYGLDLAIDAFKRQHHGVDVKILHLPAERFWGSYQQSLDIGVATDLVFTTDHYLENEVDGSQFIDLRDSLGDSLEKVYDKVLSCFIHNETVIAAPLTFTSVYLVYNPSLFHEHHVPLPTKDWTTEQFLEACRLLTIPENRQVGLSLIPSFRRWPVFVLQSSSDPESHPVNKHSLGKAFHLLETILFQQRAAVMYHRMDSNPFLYGRSAMTLATTFEVASWAEVDLPFTPQIAPLPFGSKKSTLLQSNAFMIPKTSSNPDLAHSFIRIALGNEVQTDMVRNTPFLSVNQQINEAVRGVPLLQAMNVDAGNMMDNHYLQDLFPLSAFSEREVEADLFWMGLSSVPATVEAIMRTFE